MATTRKTIPLSKLQMDLENPRHPEAESQKAIIDWMTSGPSKSGEKLLELTKDIAAHGINPADQINVIATSGGNYKVLEGNRRVTATKLLANPDSAPKSWQERFRKVANAAKHTPKSLESIIWDNAEEAYHFIELKHMGAANGAGTVAWSPKQKGRHDKRVNRTSRDWRAIQLLDYVKESQLFDANTKACASDARFPLTTLTRILSDKNMRDFLGIQDIDQELHFAIEGNEAAKAISKVVEDLGSKAINVSELKNAAQREEYRNSFSKPDRPDSTKQITPTPLSTPTAPASTPTPKATPLPGKTPVRAPANRTTLVPAGTNIPIPSANYAKIRAIYSELRNLKIDNGPTFKGFPIAASALFRAFLELSVNEYISVMNVVSPSPNGWNADLKLVDRIKAVKSVVDPSTENGKGYKKWLNQITSNPFKDGSPNMLNDVVHSDSTLPSTNDLKTIWDNYQPFLEAIWIEIKDSLAV